MISQNSYLPNASFAISKSDSSWSLKTKTERLKHDFLFKDNQNQTD